jgi:carbonic anhydrase/acetyltransferase-like protein (isoleucine patch superfamily)
MSDGSDPKSNQKIDPSVWIAPSAQLYGAIAIARDASIWHNAVLRAECQRIEIGRMTNLQDFAMLHIAYDNPTIIGEFCSITHHTTVHGCTVGDHCLVGIGATIMDHAVIGEGSIVAGGAFVTEGSVFPPHSIIAGVPAKKIGQRDCARPNRLNAWMYQRNAEFTRRGDYRAWAGAEYEAWYAAKRAEIEADRDL